LQQSILKIAIKLLALGIQKIGNTFTKLILNGRGMHLMVYFRIHNTIPLAFKAAAKVWVAREQWVFTLPSLHPMARAVSAVLSSSQ
jgi:hypothetical protein